MNAVCGELSRVAGNHLERLSPEELASMIEVLRQSKFNDQDDYEINVDPDLANKDAMTIFIKKKAMDDSPGEEV